MPYNFQVFPLTLANSTTRQAAMTPLIRYTAHDPNYWVHGSPGLVKAEGRDLGFGSASGFAPIIRA